MLDLIKAHEAPVVKIFKNDYRFLIPPYQRPYAWTTDQAGELLDDILYAMRSIDSMDRVNAASPYFLGSVVLVKESADEARAEIVDGQQRITTLTILFCALRELATPTGVQQLHKYVQEDSDPFAGVTGNFRLVVRERDKDFFQDNIQETGRLRELVESTPANLPDSQQRMLENAKHLWERVQKLDDRRRDTLAAFLVQRCMLVVVAASDRASAYRIFSVMNDRGLDLSPTDILKADVIGPMNPEIQSKYTTKWEDFEEEVGRDGFRNLFAHIRMIYVKKKIRGTLQQEFQDEILKKMDNAVFIDKVLEPYADAYDVMTRSRYESPAGSDRVNKYLRYLNRLDNFDWIPPAMAFFKKFPNNTDSLARFVRDLERLAYGMFLVRADVNRRLNRYADVLRAIERDDDLYADASPLQLSLEDKKAVLDALDGQLYDRNRVNRVGMPLLLRLDSALAAGGATYDHPIVTIEHVLPQHPDAASEWMTNFSEDERREWTGKLANLVLLSRRKNSQAQNYDFERKKREYFQKNGVTPFALTTQVVNESEWTPDVLGRRQRRLMDTLKKEWRLG